jgi:L-ascorbate metabolism protein UlaG (beta-lactamase superfamily)
MDARAAAEAAVWLRPRIAIPIHWGTMSPVGMADSGEEPAREFAGHVAQLAPGVRVVLLAPGESCEI